MARKPEKKHMIKSEPVEDPRGVEDTRGVTAERLRHAAGAHEWGTDERERRTILTMRDSPLERAHARRVLTDRQYAAGVKYRNHWYRAGLSAPLNSLDPNRIFASDSSNFGGMAKTEAQAFHRQQYRKALEAVGLIGSGVVEHIACHEISIEEAGYLLGWGSRPQAYAAAVERLRISLDQLAKLWGI